MKIATRLVNFQACPGDPYQPSTTPIYQTATFEQESPLEFGAYDYTRSGNPTRSVLEAQLADLEAGTRAFAFGSGMAAITAVARLPASGDEILASAELYGGTFRLFSRLLTRLDIRVRYVDAEDPRAFAAAASERTKLAYIETPGNPTLSICDIAAIAKELKAKGIPLCVDNTMMSPVLQNPLALGADIVVHSGTKYLGGHGDVTAGAVCVRDDKLADALYQVQNGEGAALAPMDSWLLLRGLKTLWLRVERQTANAGRIAQRLADREEVKEVYYPGLAEHRGAEVHRRQARGAGSVIGFRTESVERSASIVRALRLFRTTVSFGSVTSTASLPAHMSHASVPAALKARHSPPADLVRLSVGIEDLEDLWRDLDRALSVARDESRISVVAQTAATKGS